MSDKSTDVLAAIAEVLPELEGTLGHTIDVARPPSVWPCSSDGSELKDVLRRLTSSLGTVTGAVTLLVSNIVVEPFDDDPEDPIDQVPSPGNYIGLSIKGPTAEPGSDGLILDLGEYAYRRAVDDEAAVVAFLPAQT